MTIEEEKQFVLKYVKLGYSPKEIVAADTTGSLTLQKVKDRKRAIIQEGRINHEEAVRLEKERAAKKLKEKHAEEAKKIKILVEEG